MESTCVLAAVSVVVMCAAVPTSRKGIGTIACSG